MTNKYQVIAFVLVGAAVALLAGYTIGHHHSPDKERLTSKQVRYFDDHGCGSLEPNEIRRLYQEILTDWEDNGMLKYFKLGKKLIREEDFNEACVDALAEFVGLD